MAACMWQWYDWPSKWPHGEGFRELCAGEVQNAIVCKVRSRGTVEVGEMYYSGGGLLKMLSTRGVIVLEVGFYTGRNCRFVWLGRSYWEATRWDVSIHHIHHIHTVSGILRPDSTCFWLKRVIFVMLYLCTQKCHKALVCTQAKVHQCRFAWLHSQPRPLIMWCCTAVDNMSVAGTKAAILKMLESTLHHEIFAWRLSTVSLT